MNKSGCGSGTVIQLTASRNSASYCAINNICNCTLHANFAGTAAAGAFVSGDCSSLEESLYIRNRPNRQLPANVTSYVNLRYSQTAQSGNFASTIVTAGDGNRL